MDVKSSGPLRFPPFRLDPDNASLWRGTTEVRLTPKAFAVLHCLVERRGQLVTKDALLERVWPGTVVGDAVLKVCIREIRKALGRSGGRSAVRGHGAPARISVHRRHHRRRRRDRSAARRRGGQRPAPLSTPRPLRWPGPPRRPGARAGPAAAVLEAAWRGTRQVVFVTGEPGIGKTGVVEAFLERAAADPRVWIAHGQCVETYGTREPYRPVLDALAGLCRESGGDWLVPLLRRHAPTWLVQMPWLLDGADRDALQRELLGATRERMLREMAEAVEALTAEEPLVLVLEDLQWSDAATVDLVSLLARRQQPARLLLIGTYRPVDVIVRPHPLKDVKLDSRREGDARSCRWSCWARPRSPTTCASASPATPSRPSWRPVINRRTEGNPLFMVSVVDDLVARGLIAVRDGRWELRRRCRRSRSACPRASAR